MAEAKGKDRSYRLAFGSLLVSVVVAIASPLSAWVIAKQGYNASSTQARDAFLRDQQMLAYQTFHASASALLSMDQKFSILVHSDLPDPQSQWSDPHAEATYLIKEFEILRYDLLENLQKVRNDLVFVNMVGATEVVEAAVKFTNLFHGEESVMVQMQSIVNRIPLSSPDVRAYLGVSHPDNLIHGSTLWRDAENLLLREFVDAVREAYGQDLVGTVPRL
ncbi:hypothetical protein [Mycolicibacterium aurum]|uniref:hypothetical protein n=1 Tax=Mycolicibacterium aurum TaxID=1791 RepID=UPI001476F560|nr:hypothetical protein [Mycolicibacterium aurum]